MQDNRERAVKINFKYIVAAAEEKAPDLEPWPNYFKLRAGEMEALFSLYRPKGCGLALDIGAGIGFNALLLKELYSNVVISDLYTEDPVTHTLGMDRSKSFLKKMPESGIKTVSSKCEGLPFRNDFFDAIYMIYTLEHIRERMKALEEARRTLKPGGELIIIVPNLMERLFYPLSFYRYVFLKIFSYLKRQNKKAIKNTPSAKGSFSYLRFPVPEAHGEYAGYCSELMNTNTFQWIRLAKKSGFDIKGIFTTMLFPKELSSLILGDRALDCYISTRWMNNLFGRKPFLRSMGQNLCLILGKNDA